jgi:D-aminoacyl-tRNA deacylase
MNFLLIVSKEDKASLNLKEELFNNYKIKKLNEYEDLFYLDNDYYKFKNNIYIKIISELHIFCDDKIYLDISNKINIDSIIFLSKHATKSDIKNKCITAHAIGNFSKAELGGKDFTVVETDPILIRSILLKLKENKKDFSNINKYKITQEATHHGPYLEKSTLFYEIGSHIDEWINKDVSKFMIQMLLEVLKDYNKEKIKIDNNWIETVGIGGSHYCTKFNKYTFNKQNKFCFGHIIPNYAIDSFEKNKDILQHQVLTKSNSKIILNENLERYTL